MKSGSIKATITTTTTSSSSTTIIIIIKQLECIVFIISHINNKRQQ